MKRFLAIGSIAVMVAAVLTAVALLPRETSSDVTSKVGMVGESFPGTSPDLPELFGGDAKIVAGTEFAGTSPDLPEINSDTKVVRVTEYRGTSPDLPEIDSAEEVNGAEQDVNIPDDIFGGPSTEVAKNVLGMRVVEYRGTSPDLPEVSGTEAHIKLGPTDLSAGLDEVYERLQREIAGLPVEEDRHVAERSLNTTGFTPLPWDDHDAEAQMEYLRKLEIANRIIPQPWDDAEAAIQLNHDKGLDNDRILIAPLPWDDMEAEIQLRHSS